MTYPSNLTQEELFLLAQRQAEQKMQQQESQSETETQPETTQQPSISGEEATTQQWQPGQAVPEGYVVTTDGLMSLETYKQQQVDKTIEQPLTTEPSTLLQERDTQITTGLENQELARQGLQRGVAMGVISPIELQKFEQSIIDLTNKQELLDEANTQVQEYERYIASLERLADEGGYTLGGKDLTHELVEQKKQEYKADLDDYLRSTVALTSPFSDLNTGKLNLASAIKLGQPEYNIQIIAETISKNMPEDSRIEPERLIELTTKFESYRKGDSYNVGDVIDDTIAGVLNRQDVQEYFGEDTIKKVQVSEKLANYKTEGQFDMEAIIDGINRGTVSNEDVETLFGKETVKIIESYNEKVKEIENSTRNEISNVALTKGIQLSDTNEPTFTEIESLIRNGVSPSDLAAAGYSITEINIAIAVINQEYNTWKTARDKLANAGFTQPLQQVKSEYQDEALMFVPTPSGKEFTISNLAEWQRDNPQDNTTIETYLGKDIAQDVFIYNDSKGKIVDYINSSVIPRQSGITSGIDLSGGEGIALERALSQLGIDIVGGGGVTTWRSLDEDTKYRVAEVFAKDAYKSNAIASIGATIDQLSAKSIPTMLLTAPIQPISHVVAKQLTIKEARELLKDEYRTELESLKNYVNEDGSFDVSKFSREVNSDPELRETILTETGYDDIDALKQNLEYYNNSVKVTGEEWTLAGAVAVLDALMLGGGGALSGLGTTGKYISSGLAIGAGGLMFPSSLKVLTSAEASGLEKGMAFGIPVVIISGGVIGLLPKTIGVQSVVGKVKTVTPTAKVSLMERVGDKLDDTGYMVSKIISDETSRAILPIDVKYPNFIKIIKDASGKVKYQLTGVAQETAKIAEEAIRKSIQEALKAKTYLKYGIKKEVIEALTDNVKQAKIAYGLSKYVAQEIKIGIQRGVKVTDELIEQAIVKGLVTREYLLDVLSKDVGKAIASNTQYVKYLAKDIAMGINKRYTSLVDDLMVKGIIINDQVMKILSTKVFPDIKTIPGMTRYAYQAIKGDIARIARMTNEQADKFITAQLVRYIKLKNATLDILSTDVSGAIGYLAKELRNNIKRGYANAADLSREALNTIIKDAIKARDYLKYGLKEDVVKALERNKKIAEYFIERTKQGIDRGVADSYNSKMLRGLLNELDDAVKAGDKDSLLSVSEKLVALGDDAPRYNGVNLAELGRQIRVKLIKAGEIVDDETMNAIQEWLNGIKRIEDLKTSITKTKLDAVKEKYLKEYKQRVVRLADDIIDNYLESKQITPEQIAQRLDDLKARTQAEKLNVLKEKYLQEYKQRIVNAADDVIDNYLESKTLTPEQLAQRLDDLKTRTQAEKINVLKEKYLKDYQQRIVNLADEVIDLYEQGKLLTPEQIAQRLDDLKLKIIDEKLNILKEKYLQSYKQRIIESADEVLDIYEKGKELTPEQIAQRLDDLKARTQADKLNILKEQYSRQRESYIKELNELLDSFGEDIEKLGIKKDDIESLRKLLSKIETEKAQNLQRQAYQKELEQLLDDLGDELDNLDDAVKNKPDISPDELDEIVKGDNGGTKTAVKEKTEVKPKTEIETKTAEELEELFKKEVKPETEAKPKTKTPSKTQPKVDTGVIAPTTVIRSTYLGSGLIETPSRVPQPEIKPLEFPERPSVIPTTEPITPYPEIETTPFITPIPVGEPKPIPEKQQQILGQEMFEVKPEEEPQEQPYPEPELQPVPEEVGYKVPEIEDELELEEYPITETTEPPLEPQPLEPPVKTPVKPLPLKLQVKDSKGEEKEIEVKPGTVVWIQGRPKGGAMYRIVLPPYGEDNFYATREVPPGYVDEGWTGEGSVKESLQVIGGLPDHSIKDLDLGIARINITVEGGEPEIEFVSDRDSNTGDRKKTVGMGIGQIPIEEWEEAKAQGIEYQEFIRDYSGRRVGEKQEVKQEVSQKRLQEIYDIDGEIAPDEEAWYERAEPVVKTAKMKKKPVEPSLGENIYFGRRTLPNQYNGGL